LGEVAKIFLMGGVYSIRTKLLLLLEGRTLFIYPLRDYARLVFSWIPEDSYLLLDLGSSAGYYTVHFAKKCKRTCGVDPNKDQVRLGKKIYPWLEFLVCAGENLPFKTEAFDTLTVCEVIEHVKSERALLKEAHRILKKGGTLILTTPHKGLFSFLDYDNIVYMLSKIMPSIRRLTFRGDKSGAKPGYTGPHKRYSVKELRNMVEEFFKIVEVFTSGLFLYPLAYLLAAIGMITLGKNYMKYLDPFIRAIMDREYFKNYGRFSYNLAIKATKKWA